MTHLFFQCSKILSIAAVLLILVARFSAMGRGTGGDLLAYTIGGIGRQPTSLMLYDFGNGSNTSIFSSNEPIRFSLSDDGRLAYSSRESGEGEIYVLDTRAADSIPINITQTPATDESPLAWSPDSRYLAFVVSRGERPQLYVWNGGANVNITPNDTPDSIESYQVAWSGDRRLAFRVGYGTDGNLNDEVYIWDGKTTINLSQNPIGHDGVPHWKKDEEVLFFSSLGGNSYIMVWDGMRTKSGIPKLDKLTIPPELNSSYSGPIWTPNGNLVVLTELAQDTHLQIYHWDGQTVSNISQNPTLHNGTPVWSNDGRWAFTTFFSSQQLLYVRDADNRPLLTTEGQSIPAWSPHGLLMFCGRGLAVWDGQQIAYIRRGWEIRAKWGNGNGIVCSAG